MLMYPEREYRWVKLLSCIIVLECESRTLAMYAYEATGETPDHVHVIANAHWEPHDFALPAVVGRRWHLAVDTMQEPPVDMAEPGAELRLPEAERVVVGPRSVVVLVAR